MNIHKAEAKALSKEDLQSMLNTDVNILDYDILGEMTLDQVLVNGMAIILMHIHSDDGSRKPVGHWVALIRQGDHIEHFDSYGLRIDEELHLTHESKHLSNLLHGHIVKNDNVQLQEFKDDVNTCGRHCVVRCMMKDVDYEHYVQFMKSLKCKPDEAVTLMTFFSH